MTVLSPDPLGYRDSSNLYSFAGGDPVNGRDPLGMGNQEDADRPAFDAYTQHKIATEQAEAESATSARSIFADTVGGSIETISTPFTWTWNQAKSLLNKRDQVEATFADAGQRLAGLFAPGSHRQSDSDVREAARQEGATAALMQERASLMQNKGLRPIAQKGGSIGGKVIYGVAEAGVVVGVTKAAGVLRSGVTALNEYDIDYYGTFKARKGDQLAGHEMLQNAWIEANTGAKRGVDAASTMNPAVAVSHDLHVAIGREQRALELFDRAKLSAMSASKNIELNELAMRRAGVPEHVIQTLKKEALKHAATIP